MTMTLSEIVKEYGKEYKRVWQLHEDSEPVPGQRAPETLLEGVRSLCQRSLDAICALVDEPWLEKDSEHYETILLLIKMLEGFGELAARIQNRSDVPSEEGKRIEVYRNHKRMRTERLERMIQQQQDNREFLHAEIAR